MLRSPAVCARPARRRLCDVWVTGAGFGLQKQAPASRVRGAAPDISETERSGRRFLTWCRCSEERFDPAAAREGVMLGGVRLGISLPPPGVALRCPGASRCSRSTRPPAENERPRSALIRNPFSRQAARPPPPASLPPSLPRPPPQPTLSPCAYAVVLVRARPCVYFRSGAQMSEWVCLGLTEEWVIQQGST